MRLALAWERCVRTRAKAATCRACVDACPTGAIELAANGSIAVAGERCTDCGQCVPACPTEAFSGVFDAAAFTAAVAGSPEAVRCKTNDLPCAGALAAEELVVLARRRGGQGASLEACEGCSGATRLSARASEANALLSALGAPERVWVKMRPPPPAPPPPPRNPVASRRALLRRFLPLDEPSGPQAAPPPPAGRLELMPTALDVKKIRARGPTARRLRTLEVLGNVPRERRATVLGTEEVQTSSDKRIDAALCTACMACVNTCPTEALTTTRHLDEVRFESSRCVKCGTCHDVCAPRALTLAPTFDPEGLRSPQPRVLVRLSTRRCVECGEPFKAGPGEALCPRCASLDDEARELVGFGRTS